MVEPQDSLDFKGRAVVITGAGRGLGREFALLLAARGAQVLVNDFGGNVHGVSSDASPADAVVGEITAAGGTAVANYDSVADPAGGRAIIAAARQAFGRVDALIHNAGILRDVTIAKMQSEALDAVIDVHLKGAFNVVVPAFPVMKEQGYGRVVLISSGSGLFGNFGQANYGAAKTGLLGLMRVLNLEGARAGIKANCVAPSARTRMTEDLLGPFADKLDPVHVAPLVAYLCSEQNMLHNQIFSAGGGRFARVFMGLTPGWYSGGAVATVEDIAAHIDEIRDPQDYSIPDNGMDELEIMRKTFGIG